MHNILNPFKQSPSQKFHKTSLILKKKNPKNFQKPQKLGKKCMKCMIKRWKRDHTSEKCKEKTKDRVGKMKRLSLWCLGDGETLFCRERYQGEMREIRIDPIYRHIRSSMYQQVSRGVKNKNSTDTTIERCPQVKNLDRLRSYRESIEHTETSLMDWASIEQI